MIDDNQERPKGEASNMEARPELPRAGNMAQPKVDSFASAMLACLKDYRPRTWQDNDRD